MKEEKGMNKGKCKFCGERLEYLFADLEFYQDHVQGETGEEFNLTSTYVCSHCFMVQSLENVEQSDSENFYLSSFSSSRLTELQKYTNCIFKKFDSVNSRLVAEFNVQRIPGGLIFGNRNLHTLIDVYGKADFLMCHDAVTHSLDINDFISALTLFLKPEGSVTFEFLHLLPWMEKENGAVTGVTFPYYSFATFEKILRYHGLLCYDVIECLPPGTVRVYAKHKENYLLDVLNSVPLLRLSEKEKGISELTTYLNFKSRLKDINPLEQPEDQYQLRTL